MHMQRGWLWAALTVVGLTLTPQAATATNAWFGGGYYDGYNGARGLGAPDYPQVNNAMGATNVTETNAFLTGMLVSTGAPPAEVRAFWARADGGKDVAAWAAAPGAGSRNFGSVGLFELLSHEIAVDPGEYYYYRFFATNAAGQTGWAFETVSFLTPAPPAVSTGPGAGVGITTAGLHVELTAGIAAQVWLDWGTADLGQPPGVTNTVDLGVRTVAGTPEVPNPHRYRLEGLTASTTYAYRIRAENDFGTAESDWVWFVTNPTDFITTEDLAWYGGGYYDGYDWNEDLLILDRSIRGTIIYVR